MNYSFKDIHSRARVATETDKYVVYQTLKSKLYFSGNYLLMKKTPETIEELDYYISACRNFFRDKGVNFIHLVSQENIALSKKLKKHLKKENYTEINLDLYYLDTDNFVEQEDSGYDISYLTKKDLNNYLEFQYKIDLESSDEEWADGDKIIGTANIIVKADFFEIDNLYVSHEYRRKGVAMHLINFAVKNEQKKNVLLVADANDTPKYMYEKIGFKKISEQDFYLKTKL